MDKIKMLKELGYNNGIIEDVKKNRRHCDILPEGELQDYIDDAGFEFTVEQAREGRVEGVDIYRHEDGFISYVILES